MTEFHFQQEMQRLVETFGKAAFGSERAKILWREVGMYSNQWFTQVVDRFIGELRQAPLMPEFREAISKERERLWAIEKKQNEKEAKAFASTFPLEDIGSICRTIVQRIQGGMTDENYNSFIKAVEGASDQDRRASCKHCTGDGLVWETNEEGYEFIYRCVCDAGAMRSPRYPSYFEKLSQTRRRQ